MRFVISRLALIVFSVALITTVSILTGATRWQAHALGVSDEVRRISPAELREALQKGEAVLIDVRNEESYNAGHIKGALLIPVSDVGARIKDVPKDKFIATYCS